MQRPISLLLISLWELRWCQIASAAPAAHSSLRRMWIANQTRVHKRSLRTGEDKSDPHHTHALPSLDSYLTHCCSVSSVWSFVISFPGERQLVSKTRREGVITMVCVRRPEWGGGCWWKRRMIGAFESDLFEKQHKTACTWNSKGNVAVQKHTTLMQLKINHQKIIIEERCHAAF